MDTSGILLSIGHTGDVKSRSLGMGTSPANVALGELIAQIQELSVEGLDASAVGQSIAGHVENGRLNVGTLAGDDRRAIGRLPPVGWEKLHRYTTAMNNPIHSVVFPIPLEYASAPAIKLMLTGMSQLGALQKAEISILHDYDKDHGKLSLDLSSLRAPKLTTIEVSCGEACIREMEVRAAQGREVTTAHALEFAQGKFTVQYVDDDDKPVGDPVKLAGSPYFRKNSSVENLNQKCDIAIPTGALQRHDPKAKCKLIALAWARKRMQEYYGSTTGGTKPQSMFGSKTDRMSDTKSRAKSFVGFQTAEDIVTSVDPEGADHEFELLRQSTPDSMFDYDSFGGALDTLAAGMKPGELRWGIVNTDNHTMAIEIHLKPRKKVFEPSRIVIFFDPNKTKTYTRVDRRSERPLTPLRLASFLRKGLVDGYRDAPIGMAAIYRYPISSGIDTGARLHVSNHVPESRIVEWLFISSHPDAQIRLQACLGPGLTSTDRDNLQRGFRDAMSGGLRGSHDYMQSVLDSKVEPGVRYLLLSATQQDGMRQLTAKEPVASRGGEAIRSALRFGHADSVKAYAQLVSNADDMTLIPNQRRNLLLAPTESMNLSGSAPDITPALHDVCDREKVWHHHPSLHANQVDSICAYVGEIVKSKHLSEEDKALLCRADNGWTSAADAAVLSGNPAGAAAIACAVLGNGGKFAWLQYRQRPTPDSILAALDTKDPLQAQWRARLVKALESPSAPTQVETPPTTRNGSPSNKRKFIDVN